MTNAAADVDPSGPAVEVALRRLLGVAAVNEQQPQRHSPTAGDDGRLPDDRYHMVVQSRGVERVPQRRQRVEQSGDRVDHRRVVVFPPSLVLLGTVVVVDGVNHAAASVARRRPSSTVDLPQYVPISTPTPSPRYRTAVS